MLLRTLAGAHAGQIQEYAPVAGRAALQTGTAARVADDGGETGAVPPATRPARSSVMAPRPSKKKKTVS